MNHIFISYVPEDVEIMRRVRATLEANQFTTWTDEQLLPDVADRKRAIRDALDEAEALVVILSPEAKDSTEITSHFKYSYVHNIPVYPVLARGDAYTSVPHDLDTREMVYVHEMGRLIKNLGFQEKLRLFIESIPNAYFMGIITIDGLRIAAYVRRHLKNVQSFAREDRISAMSAAMLSLGERIVSVLNSGIYQLGVFRGTKGTIVCVVIGDEYVVSLGIAEVKSFDAVLVKIGQELPPILELLKSENRL